MNDLYLKLNVAAFAGIGLQFTGLLEYFPFPQLIIGFLIGGKFGFFGQKHPGDGDF